MAGIKYKKWIPLHELELVAGTPPGGGLDRAARALAKSINENDLAIKTVKVSNVPGDGARAAWKYVDRYKGDPHIASISSPNLTTDKIVGLASFDQRDYSPLAILYTEYISFIAGRDSLICDGQDLLTAFKKNAGDLKISLSTALGNPNHIAVSQVAMATGCQVNALKIRVFNSALDVVEDVISGNADIGAVTAASIVKAMKADQLQALAVSAPDRLGGLFNHVPTWREQGIECVVGAWRGVTGPAALNEAQVSYWRDLLKQATETQTWIKELETNYWSAHFLDGSNLKDYLEREQKEFESQLKFLGLNKI